MIAATLFTQPGCGACVFAARDLDAAGIEYVARDVRTDADAATELVAMFAVRHPGRIPTTPVAVIGGETLFGAGEIHQHIRDMARAAA
ncbi:glutaredoxin family protein [Mycobacteroides abscessus]|uniref:glutaredoxin family protein n=1 Tax=Mycobacteroides abscessus TaxID=36809 RepID=UPI002670354A|nr:glutaredoxin family protein [Mycobacteroides abscessus]MDO3110450.1 glutaredoxin family protein [Mycobacteroides abscessus subsp. abscessus]